MTRAPSMTPAPSPTAATDETAYMAELRRLKTWSGHSFRQLERRASAVGDTLPYSTVATMLSKNRLPREDLLVTFVRACGVDEAAVKDWATVRARIACGVPVDAAGGNTKPPRRWTFLWRPALVGAAVVLAFAAGAALNAETVNIEQDTAVGTLTAQ